MDQALRNALKRKKELENELAEIGRFIELHQRFSGTKREKTELSPMNIADESNHGLRSHADIKPENMLAIRHRRGQPDDFANMMARIIGDLERPLTRTELVAALEERRVTIPSSDKERYLGTILWRHRDRFKNFPRVGYWLAGRPWQDYYPSRGTMMDPIDLAEHRDQPSDFFDDEKCQS